MTLSRITTGEINMRMLPIPVLVRALTLVGAILPMTACGSKSSPTGASGSGAGAGASPTATAPAQTDADVVLYSSIDEPELTPIVRRFEKATGLTVRVVTDTEATKTTALVQRLQAEHEHMQADVYWGNELFNTINLSEAGYFDRYRPPTAEDVPADWRSADDLYTCVGVRARTIAISTRPEFAGLVAGIHGLQDLANPALKGKIGISDPAFGTVSAHLAALDVLWGDNLYRRFLEDLRANGVELLPGNSVVADEIVAGKLAVGTTDNDDVATSRDEGGAITGVLPDQGDSGEGTLLVPGSVALLHGAPHSEAAKQLMDYLCSPAVEQELIDAHYIGYSVRKPVPVHGMKVNPTQCAHAMKHAIEMAKDVLRSPE
jgi:iron(III) transport system substrate-binding protein